MFRTLAPQPVFFMYPSQNQLVLKRNATSNPRYSRTPLHCYFYPPNLQNKQYQNDSNRNFETRDPAVSTSKRNWIPNSRSNLANVQFSESYHKNIRRCNKSTSKPRVFFKDDCRRSNNNADIRSSGCSKVISDSSIEHLTQISGFPSNPSVERRSEDPDPGGLSSTTTDSSSSSSESNKENSLPPSQSPSPIMHKGLSRRQRKNRKREHSHTVVVSKSETVEVEEKTPEESSGIKSQKKSSKTTLKNGAVVNGGLTTKHIHHRHNQSDKGGKEYSHLELQPLEEFKKLKITEEAFGRLLATKYSLKQENMAILGYPVRPAKRPHLDRHYQMMVFPNAIYYYVTTGHKKHHLDVHAEEFIPRNESGDSGNGSEGSGSSSEEESSSGSEGSDDIPLPKLAPGTINRKDVHSRICVRCGSFFYTTSKKYITLESCSYHWGKLRTLNYGYGPLEYTCCRGASDSKGCASGKLHVWNGPVEPVVNSSFVETEPPKIKHTNNFYGVFSLDCEMSYTVLGLEVVKVSVVDISGKPVYNEFVRPKNEIVDFNTRFSGITEQVFVNNNPKSLAQVQKDIKKLICSETVLIGHGLENDLKVLKIIHKTIVDTSYTFPHYKGLPYKRSLRSLTRACLKRDIQTSEKGHDSFEDARACMELMLYRLRRDFNL